MTTTPPRWDLSNVFPGLETPEFDAAIAQVKLQIDELEKLFTERVRGADAQTPVAELAGLVGEAIERFNKLYDLSGTVRAFISSFITTDSRNTTARRRMSEFEQVGVRMQNLNTQFQSWVGRISPALEGMIAANPTAAAHAFMLKEIAEQSKYLMSDAEEALAAELNLSGGNSWGNLQGVVTSQLSVDFELDGKIHKMPLPAIINLHSHPDESVRHRAYEAELALLESMREPLAASLNGVKGTVNTLDKRRGRQDALHSAIDDARIDRASLEAMLGAMEASFPAFRKYFKAKAKRLGKEKLAWWDIFAPTSYGKDHRPSKKAYDYPEGREFILENFGKFSPDLSSFAAPRLRA